MSITSEFFEFFNKVQFFWEGHKIRQKLPLVMTLLSKTAVLSKQVGDFFPILWPSHNVLTLPEFT